MEGESAAAPTRRWAENVIVLSSGRPPRSEEAAVVAGQGQHQRTDAPPEKLYYKTRLCDKYEATGRCVYEDGCTFAHGGAELRPPVPPHAHAVWRRPPDQEHGGRIVYGGGKACHNFRDRGHFGDKLAFPHAAAPAPPGTPGAYATLSRSRSRASVHGRSRRDLTKQCPRFVDSPLLSRSRDSHHRGPEAAGGRAEERHAARDATPSAALRCSGPRQGVCAGACPGRA